MDGLVVDRETLVVEVRDPLALGRAERVALLERCARADLALYASARHSDDPSLPYRLGAQLGLVTPQPVSSPEPDGSARVPWHTVGYRNPAGLTVRSTVLHCAAARSAIDVMLLDVNAAWQLLREQGEPFVRALMQPDAFTVEGREEPHAVFSADARGEIHMRFTERRDAIRWKFDATVAEAAARLRRLLDRDTRVLHVRLQPGMGVIGNNPFVSRAMLPDAGAVRMLRAAFRERIVKNRGA